MVVRWFGCGVFRWCGGLVVVSCGHCWVVRLCDGAVVVPYGNCWVVWYSVAASFDCGSVVRYFGGSLVVSFECGSVVWLAPSSFGGSVTFRWFGRCSAVRQFGGESLLLTLSVLWLGLFCCCFLIPL